jgi:hypothetical protein
MDNNLKRLLDALKVHAPEKFIAIESGEPVSIINVSNGTITFVLNGEEDVIEA